MYSRSRAVGARGAPKCALDLPRSTNQRLSGVDSGALPALRSGARGTAGRVRARGASQHPAPSERRATDLRSSSDARPSGVPRVHRRSLDRSRARALVVVPPTLHPPRRASPRARPVHAIARTMFTVAAAPASVAASASSRVAGKSRAVSASGVRAASARRGAALVARAGFTPAGANRRRRHEPPRAVPHQRRPRVPGRDQRRVDQDPHRHRQAPRHQRRRVPHPRRRRVPRRPRDGGRLARGRRPRHPRHLLPDDVFGSACTLQAAIGAEGALAYDITAACSGFVVGLVNGVHFIRGGEYKNVLVVGAGRALARRLARSRHVHPLRRRVRRDGADGDGETRGLLPAGFRHAQRRTGNHNLTAQFVNEVGTETNGKSKPTADADAAAAAAPSATSP